MLRHHTYDEEPYCPEYLGDCACCREPIYRDGDSYYDFGNGLYACQEHGVEVMVREFYVSA